MGNKSIDGQQHVKRQEGDKGGSVGMLQRRKTVWQGATAQNKTENKKRSRDGVAGAHAVDEIIKSILQLGDGARAFDIACCATGVCVLEDVVFNKPDKQRRR